MNGNHGLHIAVLVNDYVYSVVQPIFYAGSGLIRQVALPQHYAKKMSVWQNSIGSLFLEQSFDRTSTFRVAPLLHLAFCDKMHLDMPNIINYYHYHKYLIDLRGKVRRYKSDNS